MLGSNQFGQLGIENMEIASSPTIIPVILYKQFIF